MNADIQLATFQLLFLPPTRQGFDRLLERHLRAVARLADWEGQKQRKSFF
ncbi:MAG: hypothetical protein ACJ746_18550 [Bryobacteraceae bacterium]